MVVFSVKFDKFSLEILTGIGKYFFQVVKNLFCKNAIAVFCNKCHVSMKKEDTVSFMSDVVDFFYRPTMLPLWKNKFQLRPKAGQESLMRRFALFGPYDLRF